jgi:predicted DsbA family dithiol-disulfide isomerase
MTALGRGEGIEFEFENGEVANTLHAHRVLGVLQERWGSAVALRALESLYVAYFEKGQHPSSEETLMEACVAAGVGKEEARELVGSEEGKVETERKIREVSGDGVDSVPWVVFEGRKRDFTLVGAKEVGEYLKVMEQVVKEAS